MVGTRAAVESRIQGFECGTITAAVLTSDSKEVTREAEGLDLRQLDWDSLEKELAQFGIGASPGTSVIGGWAEKLAPANFALYFPMLFFSVQFWKIENGK